MWTDHRSQAEKRTSSIEEFREREDLSLFRLQRGKFRSLQKEPGLEWPNWQEKKIRGSKLKGAYHFELIWGASYDRGGKNGKKERR